MKFYKEGEHIKAACESCQALSQATFMLRDVPFSDGTGVVKNVLAGVCDDCDDVIVMPHQSVPAIKKKRQTTRKALETRVPSHFIDILNVACDAIGASPDFAPTLMKYYVLRIARNEISTKGMADLLKTDLASGKATKRLSYNSMQMMDGLNTIKSQIHVGSTTDAVKGVVLKINSDLIERKSLRRIKELTSLAEISA